MKMRWSVIFRTLRCDNNPARAWGRRTTTELQQRLQADKRDSWVETRYFFSNTWTIWLSLCDLSIWYQIRSDQVVMTSSQYCVINIGLCPFSFYCVLQNNHASASLLLDARSSQGEMVAKTHHLSQTVSLCWSHHHSCVSASLLLDRCSNSRLVQRPLQRSWSVEFICCRTWRGQDNLQASWWHGDELWWGRN